MVGMQLDDAFVRAAFQKICIIDDFIVFMWA
jgi:hypothetical protein